MKFLFGKRVLAWISRNDHLIAENEQLKKRISALVNAHDEAISNALLFENSDLTKWIQDISSSSKGALGVRLKESEERVRELERHNLKLSEEKAVIKNNLDRVLEAWEIASIRTAKWDKKKQEWIPVEKDLMLPDDVLDRLKVWINRDGKS